MSTVTKPFPPGFYPQRPKPYTPPKPKGETTVTIAAGFVCGNGIVLGADTELTLPNRGKTYERKIFEINGNHGCYLAYTGDAYLVKDLVGELHGSTGSLSATECLETVQNHYRTKIEEEANKTVRAGAKIDHVTPR